MSRDAARKGLLLVILLASGWATLSAQVAFSKQSFTDEAGELLYTIDDEGVVSMFENSPGTDVTLSVTRGTREQMRPQITEVTPESVPAGTHNILRLTGKNLVGATVKLSVPAIEVGAYVGKPKKLDIPIHVPLTVTPGTVVLEVATPIGITTAMFRITEVQIGGGGGPAIRGDVVTHPGMGYGADDGSGPIATIAPSSCPPGMVGVSGEGGGFCIELDRTFTGDFQAAEQFCAMAGNRLCRLPEWKLACEQTMAKRLPLKNMQGEWEWTAGFDILQDDTQQDTRYFLLGQTDCETEHGTMRINAEKFAGRCCR